MIVDDGVVVHRGGGRRRLSRACAMRFKAFRYQITRAGDAPRASIAVRLCDARAGSASGAGRECVAAPRDRPARPAGRAPARASGSDQQRRERKHGQIALKLPAGWTSVPASLPFSFTRAGEKATYRFMVGMGILDGREYPIEAIATANGQEFKQGYDVIEHRDLETRYLFRDAVSRVRGVSVTIAPGLQVGYVMGVGDEVPAGIAQLGARVRLLEAQDLASVGSQSVPRDCHRDSRLRGSRRSPHLQSPSARLRAKRRQSHRPLQHAGGVRSERVRPVSGAAPARRRGSLGRRLARRDSRARPAGVHDAERHHQGGFRGLG